MQFENLETSQKLGISSSNPLDPSILAGRSFQVVLGHSDLARLSAKHRLSRRRRVARRELEEILELPDNSWNSVQLGSAENSSSWEWAVDEVRSHQSGDN